MIVAPYNAHVAAIERAFAAAGLGDPFVGTVDKFQGQERPVSIYAMGTSAPEDAPRGMEFLYSLNRLNVATSTGPLRGGRRLLPGPAAGRLPDASPDAAGERPVPGRRGSRGRDAGAGTRSLTT